MEGVVKKENLKSKDELFRPFICLKKKHVLQSLKPTSQNQSVKRRLISQNWSVTLTVAVEKMIFTLKLILMNQLTWPLIDFLLLK